MSRDKTWNDRIVAAIQHYNKPIPRKVIREYLEGIGLRVSGSSLGVAINNAKKDGILKDIKPMKGPSYYGNPSWFTEEGKLKEGYTITPHWDKATA